MATTIESMSSLPPNPLLDGASAAPSKNPTAATAAPTTAASELDPAAEVTRDSSDVNMAAARANYATPKRISGLPAVTPQEEGPADPNPAAGGGGQPGGAVASASQPTPAKAGTPARPVRNAKVLPPVAPSPMAVARAAAASAPPVRSSAAHAARKIKGIQLGPRVTPAAAAQPPPPSATKLPAPRTLEARGARQSSRLAARQDAPATPARQFQQHPAPQPSGFLAAKISPLRSKSARSAAQQRPATPPPEADPKISPGMFLSPRTPKPLTGAAGGGTRMSSGMTPRFDTGLTPTNFASDFGRGHPREEGAMSSLDASNVFAWLQSPNQGVFSPSGGLHSLDTPRGMYGFHAPSTMGKGAGGAPKLAPSPSKFPPGAAFGGLEAGGVDGVDTPRIPGSQHSMICISPMASRKSKAKAGAKGAAPESPINFSEVFASPRFPTPRISRPPPEAAMKAGEGPSALSPVVSALHTAERNVSLDDDLHALLQLAETTTPGGRPMSLLSPMLSNSLRRGLQHAAPAEGEPPVALQLPMIAGAGVPGAPPGSAQKLARKGSNGGMSPPQLAVRANSSGLMEVKPSPVKSSRATKKGRKRKAPAAAAAGSPLTHFSHQPPAANAQYYHHPGYPAPQPGLSYPTAPSPQQHYAYVGQPAAPAAAASPVKEAKAPTKKRGRGRPARPKPAPKPAPKKKRARRARTPPPAIETPEEIPSAAPPAPATDSKRSGRKAPARKARKAAPKRGAAKNAPSSPVERQRIEDAIAAVNSVYGTGAKKKEKLQKSTLRGVTQRPSGKWQAQLYYAGKSRYIGVFDSKEKASLAYEVAREVLNEDKGEGAKSGEVDTNVTLARKAAFAGVNDLADD